MRYAASGAKFLNFERYFVRNTRLLGTPPFRLHLTCGEAQRRIIVLGDRMSVWLPLVLFLAVYLLLTQWLLPKLGMPT